MGILGGFSPYFKFLNDLPHTVCYHGSFDTVWLETMKPWSLVEVLMLEKIWRLCLGGAVSTWMDSVNVCILFKNSSRNTNDISSLLAHSNVLSLGEGAWCRVNGMSYWLCSFIFVSSCNVCLQRLVMMHEWCYKMHWVKCWLFSRIPCNVTRTSKLQTFSLQHVSSSIRLKVSWFSFLHVVFPQVLFIILMYNSC